MTDSYNIGNALVVVGLMWLGFTFGWPWWYAGITATFVVISLVSWAGTGFTDERKKLLMTDAYLHESQAREAAARAAFYQAKADYYRKRIASL